MYLAIVSVLGVLIFRNRSDILNQVQIATNFWSSIATITLYDSIFQEKARKYGLDWKMLKAISMIESWIGTYKGVVDTEEERKNAPDKADSSDNLSAGLMQITLITARDYDNLATFKKLQDPKYSVEIAAQYLKFLFRIAPQNSRQIEFVVKSYNQGQGNTIKEFKGLNAGYANTYWARYQEARKSL